MSRRVSAGSCNEPLRLFDRCNYFDYVHYCTHWQVQVAGTQRTAASHKHSFGFQRKMKDYERSQETKGRFAPCCTDSAHRQLLAVKCSLPFWHLAAKKSLAVEGMKLMPRSCLEASQVALSWTALQGEAIWWNGWSGDAAMMDKFIPFTLPSFNATPTPTSC